MGVSCYQKKMNQTFSHKKNPREVAVTPSPDQAKQLGEVAAKLQGAGDQLM